MDFALDPQVIQNKIRNTALLADFIADFVFLIVVNGENLKQICERSATELTLKFLKSAGQILLGKFPQHMDEILSCIPLLILLAQIHR